MSDLPSRERLAEALTFAHITDADGDLLQDIGSAYVEGRLVDRETIDIEAAARWTHAEMVRRGPTDLTWEAAYPEEQADHLFLALGAFGAALGDDLTVEELRTVAFGLVAAVIGDGDD